MNWTIFGRLIFLSIMQQYFSFGSVTKYVIEQPLDHFNPVTLDKFNQTYYVVEDFWQRSSSAPVILLFGSTGFVDPSGILYQGVVAEAAEKFGSLIVAVQNRYYGDSLNTEMLKLEKLPYLNIEQTLTDTAKIRKAVQRQYALTDQTNQWISMGASYGGLLSIFYRQKYAHLVDIAVGSSAPVGADNNGADYFTSIAWSLKNETLGGSVQCFKQISLAFDTFDGVLQLGNVQKLKKDFLLCEELVLTDKDRFAMAIDMSAMVVDIVAHNEMAHGQSIGRNLCPTFVRNSESYEALKELRAQNLRLKNQTCSNVSWESFVGPKYAFRDGIEDWDLYRQNPGERAWWWQACAELGFVNYCDRNAGCPLSRFVDKAGYETVCREVFNVEPGQTKKSNDLFKLLYGNGRLGVGNVIVTLGGVDPWLQYSRIAATNADRRIDTFMMNDVGHAADFYPIIRGQPESVSRTRAAVLATLQTLLDALTNRAATITSDHHLLFYFSNYFFGVIICWYSMLYSY